MLRLAWRIAAVLLAAVALARLPLPHVGGALLSLKDAAVVLLAELCTGKLLYDTLFQPRGPWGRHP